MEIARERKFSTEELFQETKRILLEYGYEGFTFSILAERLEVSRGTIYKYYENKDELITDFMIHEMNIFLIELKQIDEYSTFDDQFDFLIDLIFMDAEIHQLIGVAEQIPKHENKKVKANKERLEKLHLNMYTHLHNFYKLGIDEGKLQPHLPEGLVLGFIFQTIAIPNHYGIPQAEWTTAIKEILRQGMFTN